MRFPGWLEETCSKRDARTVRGSLLELLRQLNNLSSASSSSSSLSPALLLAALRAHGWRINTEEQDAHEMLHVVMTTIEEELEFRKADAKPSHASLLDISNIGLEDDDDDSDDLEGASPAGGPFTPGRFTRGVSLPPTPAAETPPRNPWDSGRAVSVSRDTSPSGKRRFTRWAFSVTVSVMINFILRRRSNSGVICKLGSELPSNVVSSFTKPKCQTPFTGLITCKVWRGNKSYSVTSHISPGDTCFAFTDSWTCLLLFLQQHHPLPSIFEVDQILYFWPRSSIWCLAQSWRCELGHSSSNVRQSRKGEKFSLRMWSCSQTKTKTISRLKVGL